MSVLRMFDGRTTIGMGASVAPAPGITAPPYVRPAEVEQPIRLPRLTGAPRKEISVRLRGVTFVFAIDDSGSMYGLPPMGDALGVRYAVALSIVQWLRAMGGGRVGVVHWGTCAPAAMALGPVDAKGGRKELEQTLVIPPTLGGNDLPAALDRAAEIGGPLGPDDIRLYIVITDGIESVTPRMHEAVGALPPGSVHMLLVTPGLDDGLRAGWDTVAFGSFTVLPLHDTTQMAHTIAGLLAAEVGLELPGSGTASPTPTTRKAP